MEKSETPEKLEKVDKPFIHPQPILKYQPTYRLEPTNPFDRYAVERLLKVFMDKKMKEYEEFDEETSVTLCRVRVRSEPISFRVPQEFGAMVEGLHEFFADRDDCNYFVSVGNGE